MEGRNLPSRGFDTAALIRGLKLAQWGVEPFGSTSGTNGPLQPYFMPFEFAATQVNAAETKTSVTGPPAPRPVVPGQPPAPPAERPATVTTSFEYGKDWTMPVNFRGGPPLTAFKVSGNLIFAGNGYVISKTKVNPFEGLDVKGKIVVVAGVPAELRSAPAGGFRPGVPNPLGEPCTDFWTPEQAAAQRGALAVVHLASLQQLANGLTAPVASVGPNGPAYHVVKFPSNTACASVPSIVAGPSMTLALFQGEKLTAEQAFASGSSDAKQESFALKPEKKIDLSVAVTSTPSHAENVVGLISGSDPVLKNEYVIISAHLDHIGFSRCYATGR